MMRSAQVGSALLLAVAMLAAQTGTTPATRQEDSQRATSFIISLPAPTCPVNMRALQGSGTGLVAVRGEQKAAVSSQRIHLILTNRTSSKIAGAKVKVFGLSGKNRIEQAWSDQLALTNWDKVSDLTRTLDVTFAPEGDKDVATDLVLPGFTSVSSIRLESIRYQDGSTWALAGPQACYLAPDRIMLVADR
jgi:hypothetical protein